MSEAWVWKCVDESGHELEAAGMDASFPSQEEAEAFLGGIWADLLDEGVSAVSLYREETLVYGPMALEQG